MSNKTVSMLRIRKLIQLAEQGKSGRQISLELKMGRNIVSGYLQRLHASSQSYQDLLGFDDAALSRLLFDNQVEVPNSETDARLGILEPLLASLAQELGRTGVTKQLLWEEYTQDYPDQHYGYTQFKIYLNRHMKSQVYSYHHEFYPGMEMQVDFAGDPLYLITKTGIQQACPILVCTLPYSGYTFAIALVDARQESFYYGLSKALEYFEGVPQSVKSDNMKQWVTRPDRYEPTFANATLEWGIHYQTELLATRIYSPRDKGHVESHVNIIYQRIHARLRKETFGSLGSLNNRIVELLALHNHKQMQGRTYSRYERFVSQERAYMKPLPLDPYLFKYRKPFTVNSTYHVQIASDGHFYSVPYQHVGKKAVLVYDYMHVEVYVELERVAIHLRNRTKGGYSTQEGHMPESHRAYKRSKEYNADYYLHKALQIGIYSKKIVERILSSKMFVQQTYRSCQGFLALTRKYPPERIEAACQRASESPSVSYTLIRNILEKNLDTVKEEKKSDSHRLPDHDNIRGASSYQ